MKCDNFRIFIDDIAVLLIQWTYLRYAVPWKLGGASDFKYAAESAGVYSSAIFDM